MQITVTRQQLENLNACQPGLDWFDSVATDGVWSVDWTPETQIDWIKNRGLCRWIGWAIDKKLLPLWSMSGADLYEADLYEADLRMAEWNERTIWPDGFTPEDK